MGARRRLIDGFKDKFEPDGHGFIYWVIQNKRGYSVSAAERERFVAAYERRASLVALVVNKYSFVGLLCGVSAVLALALHVDGSWTFLAAALVAVGFPRWVSHRFSARPDDELRGRPIVSRTVSKGERLWFDVRKRSWWAVGFDVSLADGVTTQRNDGSRPHT